MKELDEETALAIVFANTKRKKRKENLLTIAKAFEYLFRLYGSKKAVAEKVRLSTEMIRQFLAVLRLPKEVQKIFAKRQIDSVDIAKELLALKAPAKQVVAAKAIANSLSKDVRDIKRLVKNADISIEDAKKTILDAKPKGLHFFIMDFDDETSQAIIWQANVLKIKPAELVKGIVTDWLKQKRNKEKH